MAPKGIDWMAKLQKLNGAVLEHRDVHATVIRSPSPSFNFSFGNGWGLPLGFSLVLYGPPKSGKSLVAYLMAGQYHRDYPNGFVVRFDTEYREEGQLTPEMARIYGIDMSRYQPYMTNKPDDIYDQIENQINAMCLDGMPLGLVIIDSMSGVQGRRAAESGAGIMQTQIGDVALTNKEGLKRVLAVQRRHKFSLILTSHIAVEMDPIEQKRGNKFKMGASIGVQHHAEYFAFVEMDRRKEAKSNMLGEELLDKSKLDMNERAERTGHKIAITMKDSSMGPKGRAAEFTFDYKRGIINQHEEIFVLGVNRGVIRRPNNQMYEFSGFPAIRGEANFVEFLRDNEKAREGILGELKRQDLAGAFAAADAEAAASLAEQGEPKAG